MRRVGDVSSSAGAFPHFHRAWVTEVCLSLDTPFGAEVGGSILHVTLGEFPGSHKQVLIFFNGGVVIPVKSCCIALVGLPSLRGRDACMVLRVKGGAG